MSQFMALVREVEVDHRGCEWGRPHRALPEPGVPTGFAPVGGVGMSLGMHGDVHVSHPGPVFGDAAGALDTGAPHGRERRRPVLVRTPRGRKEPGRVTRGLPGGA
jgi:hypothetical protein